MKYFKTRFHSCAFIFEVIIRLAYISSTRGCWLFLALVCIYFFESLLPGQPTFFLCTSNMPTDFYYCGQPLDFNHFVKDVTWANEDFPEANSAMLEGLRAGFEGYAEDNIIQRPYKKQQGNNKPSHDPDEPCFPNKKSPDSNPSAVKKAMEQPVCEGQDIKVDVHDVLYGTSLIGPTSRPNSAPPLKRNGTLTVRPTIGEERKAWIMEAKRAFYLAELQRNCPDSIGYSLDDDHVIYGYHPEATGQTQSHSCPNFQRMHSRNSVSTTTNAVDDCSEGPDVQDRDSCTVLYRFQEDNSKQCEIRLSPRIEKLDKLIPKTSKEFQSTMMYVNTIFPQPSSEQVNRVPPSDASPRSSQTYAMMARMSVKEANDNSSLTQAATEPSPRTSTKTSETSQAAPASKPDVSIHKPGNTLEKSYKEAFLFGNQPPTSKTPTSMPPKKETFPQKVHPDFRSSSSFPSLPKLNRDGPLNAPQSPPLYSSILQRSPDPTPSPKLKPKSSPVQIPFSHEFDETGYSSDTSSKHDPKCADVTYCGFCRSNNEPECVYKSHSIRNANGIVICPSLRKYVCCFCGATGDAAHTIKYCPNNPIGFHSQMQNQKQNAAETSRKPDKSQNLTQTQQSQNTCLTNKPTATPAPQTSNLEEWTEAKNKKKTKKR